MTEENCAWLGDVGTFLATPERDLPRRPEQFTLERGTPQLLAWGRSIGVLCEQLRASLPQTGAVD